MTDVRVSQVAREVLLTGEPSVRVSQVAREVLLTGAPSVRVSQVAREVLYSASVAVAVERVEGLQFEFGGSPGAASRIVAPIEFVADRGASIPARVEFWSDSTNVQVSKLVSSVVIVPGGESISNLLATVVLAPADESLSKLLSSAVLVPTGESLSKLLSLVVIEESTTPAAGDLLCSGVFPDAIQGISWSVHRDLVTQTRVQRAVNGKELRRLDYPWPLRRWRLRFEFLRHADLRTLAGFFGFARGAGRCFCFEDPEDNYAANAQLLMLNSWSGAVGDGVTFEFQFARPVQPDGVLEPITAVFSLDAVYFNGSPAQLSGASWFISNAVLGTLTFAAPPPVGVVITADIAYYWRVRFVEDHLSFEKFMQNLWEVRELQIVACTR
jgi:hypothetical protein